MFINYFIIFKSPIKYQILNFNILIKFRALICCNPPSLIYFPRHTSILFHGSIKKKNQKIILQNRDQYITFQPFFSSERGIGQIEYFPH